MAKPTNYAAVIAVVAVLAVGIYAGSTFGLFGKPQAAPGVPLQVSPTTGEAQAPPAVTRSCDGINTISLLSAARNPLNSSTEYTQALLRVVGKENQVGVLGKSDLPGGQIVATGTGTAGSSLSYATIAVPCNLENFEGEIYALSNISHNSAKATYSVEGTGGQVILLHPDSTELNMTFRDTQFANTSVPAVSSTETAATAMSAGDTRSGYLDLDATANVTFAQYGASGLGIVWSLDTVTSSVFSDKAIALTTNNIVLTEIDCLTYPKTAAVRSANRCWKTDPVTTSSGKIRISWTMTADGGSNPGASDDPVLYVDDLQYIEDTDGKIRIGTHDAGGTDAGQTVTRANWDNS